MRRGRFFSLALKDDRVEQCLKQGNKQQNSEAVTAADASECGGTTSNKILKL